MKRKRAGRASALKLFRHPLVNLCLIFIFSFICYLFWLKAFPSLVARGPSFWELENNKIPQGCPKFPFRPLLSFGHQPTVILSSFPGSGNTWVRSLLERGSGILTGSYWGDPSLFPVFHGEIVSKGRHVLVLKTHYPCQNCFIQSSVNSTHKTFKPISESGIIESYQANIQILRNPYDVILSYFNFIQSNQNHTGYAQEESFRSLEFYEFALRTFEGWLLHTKFNLMKKLTFSENLWVDGNDKVVYLLSYEKLVDNPEVEMEKVFEFILKAGVSSNPLLRTINPKHAARCAIHKGFFYRSMRKIKLDPFNQRFPSNNGLTLREEICQRLGDNFQPYFQHHWLVNCSSLSLRTEN